MIENGTILQDRYLIEKQIGAGGMGAVYLAVDQRFGNHVALKETFYKDEEFGAAFEREAKLLNGLHHSALPHVSDYFTEAGEHFLVMQYIEGEDLSEVLKREGGAFPVETVMRWADSLLDALDYLHSQNPPIIHRDIKPQNLKINTRGEVVLLDFGLAKLKSEDSTAASVFGYSRKYSSLEQIQGVGTDARSDIFSLAATVYHLLAGEPPTDVLTRAADIVAGNPDPLPLADAVNQNVPTEIARILNQALALNSADRFASAQEMRERLKNSVQETVAEDNISKPEAAGMTLGAASVGSVGNQDFPALASFAAEIKNNSVIEHDRTESLAPSSSNGNISDASSDAPFESAVIADAPTIVADRKGKSRLPLVAVALVLLLCAGISTAYFINKSSANTETDDASRVQSFPKPEAAGETTESNSLPANVAADENQASNAENAAPEENTSAKEEKTYKPKPASAAKNESVKNTVVAQPRRESPGNGETRERVVEDEPLPDIESIFRGSRRDREERLRRQRQNNRQREEISDEEFRRIRRQQRRQRQNRDPYQY